MPPITASRPPGRPSARPGLAPGWRRPGSRARALAFRGSRGEAVDPARQDQPAPARGARAAFAGMAAVDQGTSAASQRGVEESLIGFELERVRLHAAARPRSCRRRTRWRGLRCGRAGACAVSLIPQPATRQMQRAAVAGRPSQSYMQRAAQSTVRTTLEVGRVLTVGSFCSFISSSSYCGERLDRDPCALHVHDLVAAGLELREQLAAPPATVASGSRASARCLCRASSAWSSPTLTTCSGLRILKSNESMSVEKMRDVALAEIGDEFRRMAQRREAEERRRLA